MPAVRRAPEALSENRYYDENAQAYAAQTADVDMSELYAAFLPCVPPGGRILDAGSGSGRDTRAFLKRGYAVEAFDASPSLALESTRLTGAPTAVVRFQDFASPPRFDGVWACASLLHVPSRELPDAMARLAASLKAGGVLYASFKHGAGERHSTDGRLFVDMNETTLRDLLATVGDLKVEKIWITEGEGVRRGKDQWINVIVRKNQNGGSDA